MVMWWFFYVVFSVLLSGSEDYLGEVVVVLKYWDGSGAFAFTSSSVVYKNEVGEACDEESEVYEIGINFCVDWLLKVEKVVLDVGGVVCWLVGFYYFEWGAYKYFIKTFSFDFRVDVLVNLIYYEDVVDLCFVVMMKGVKFYIYFGIDGVLIICEVIVCVFVEFGVYGVDVVAFVFIKIDGLFGCVMFNFCIKIEFDWLFWYEFFEFFVLC